jgi:hypothetical protein
VVPSTYFERDKTTGGKGGIEIKITGLAGAVTGAEEDIEDAEWKEVPAFGEVSEDSGE